MTVAWLVVGQLVVVVAAAVLLAVQARQRRVEEAARRVEDAARAEAMQRLLAAVPQQAREQLAGDVRDVRDTLVRAAERGESAQRADLAAVGLRIDALREATSDRLLAMEQRGATSSDELKAALVERHDRASDRVALVLREQTAKLDSLMQSIEGRLKSLQDDNTAQLEKMRQTVDEKLQGTLEKRLGESFKQVSDRLEQVHKGLGEMQNLAVGVGDLKKVFTNVKMRGGWGEVQLARILEQFLLPDQYGKNVAIDPLSGERVEFAIRMPRDDGPDLWLPVDSKFPHEDYARLVDAADRGAIDEVEQCAKQLEQAVRKAARDISEKYVRPPHSVDFGVLFLPTEGLYAEIARRPGLVDTLLQDYRVMIAGPTNLYAILTSLRASYQAVSLRKRSAEVWDVLGAVKTEFRKYGETLDKVKKKLQEATNTVEQVDVRKRAMERTLKSVESLPQDRADALLLSAAPEHEPRFEDELFPMSE